MKVFVILCSVVLCFISCNKDGLYEFDERKVVGIYQGTLTIDSSYYDFSPGEPPFEHIQTPTHEEIAWREVYRKDDRIYTKSTGELFLEIQTFIEREGAASNFWIGGSSATSFGIDNGSLYIIRERDGGTYFYPTEYTYKFRGEKMY